MKETESGMALRHLSGDAIHDRSALGKITNSVWDERWKNDGAHKTNRRNLIEEVAGGPRECL